MNKKDRTILDALENYECFASGEVFNCVEDLKDHNDITNEDIMRVYNENLEAAQEAMGW